MAYFTRTREAAWGGPSLLTMIYVFIGVIIAATHNYFQDVNTAKEIGSAILAVVFWPLILLGINMHVH